MGEMFTSIGTDLAIAERNRIMIYREPGAKQPGAVVSGAEIEFIRQMRLARNRGVGYGFMKQVIDWEGVLDELSAMPAKGSD